MTSTKKRLGITLGCIGGVLLLSACDDGGSSNSVQTNQNASSEVAAEPTATDAPASVDAQLAELISAQGLIGDALQSRALPAPDDAVVRLGKRLFFSKTLSGNRDTACATCHHPVLGGGDNMSLSIGVDALNTNVLGPQRLHDPAAEHYDGGPTVPRNAPTTFNLAGYQTTIFHDGRMQRIDGGISTPDSGFGVVDPKAGQNLATAQSRFPITSIEEMKGFAHAEFSNAAIRDLLAGRLGGYGEEADALDDTAYWISQFRDVFGKGSTPVEEAVNEANISFALGEYERSQKLTNSPWKAFVQGDSGALSDEAKAGALLFYGDANCSSCHSGDFFTDESFHNIAAPQIGRGKGHGDGGEDFGRGVVTGVDADMYKFRTPSLVNVEVTGPYTHAGAFTSLEAVVRHHLDVQASVDSFDFAALQQAGVQGLDKMAERTQKAIDALNSERETTTTGVLQDLDLTEQQVQELVAFLRALTDPCVLDRDCLAPWIANPIDDGDPNGDLLIATDGNGNEL